MAQPRGKQIPVAKWWVDEAVALIAKDERGIAGVGAALGKAIGRKTAYSKSTLSRIVNREMKITLEFTEAMGLVYDLPVPVFFPRSREEALDLARTAARYNVYDAAAVRAHEERVAELEKRPTPPQNLETMAEVHARLPKQAKQALASRTRHRHRKTSK